MKKLTILILIISLIPINVWAADAIDINNFQIYDTSGQVSGEPMNISVKSQYIILSASVLQNNPGNIFYEVIVQDSLGNTVYEVQEKRVSLSHGSVGRIKETIWLVHMEDYSMDWLDGTYDVTINLYLKDDAGVQLNNDSVTSKFTLLREVPNKPTIEIVDVDDVKGAKITYPDMSYDPSGGTRKYYVNDGSEYSVDGTNEITLSGVKVGDTIYAVAGLSSGVTVESVFTVKRSDIVDDETPTYETFSDYKYDIEETVIGYNIYINLGSMSDVKIDAKVLQMFD